MNESETRIYKMITNARKIIQYHPKSVAENDWNRACISNGEEFTPSVSYEDDTVYLVSGKGSALFIEMKLPHNNPVISLAFDGRFIRNHGEWIMLEDYINKLMDEL